MTETIFISLVGTQILAVLNPLLSILRENKPELIVLIPTVKTLDKANSIKAYLEEKLKIENVVEISSSELIADAQFPPAHEIVRKYSDRPIYFNLAGGMNFQIASCVSHLDYKNTTFLYPESTGVHQIRVVDDKVLSHKILPLPKVENLLEIFKMQGVKLIKLNQNRSNFFTWALKLSNLSVPRDALENIEINRVAFDLVINLGNEIRFLKVIHKSTDDRRTSEDFLSEVDKVVDFALDRNRAYELYHRKIFVLTNIPTISERIKKEGSGKVEVIDGLNRDLCVSGLRLFFGYQEQSPQLFKSQIETYETSKNQHSKTILLTSLGENLMPTLIALWSHRPSKAILFYTPGDSEILKIKNALVSNLDLLPVSSVSFYPVSITGQEILKMPKPDDGSVEVNISPGTKGHGAFLTLWAKVHSAEIFSIETKSQTLKSISTGAEKSLSAPSPVAYLRLTGKELLSIGKDKESLLSNSKFYEDMLDKICRQGTIYIKGDVFEELVGYVFAKLDADDVNVRVRTRWSEKTEKFLINKYGMTPHMTDIDVVARFGVNYYVISCKAGKVSDFDHVTREVSAAGKALFGRFTVPLVSHFLYSEVEPMLKNGVWIFGYKTLINQDSIRELIEKAIKERRTTLN